MTTPVRQIRKNKLSETRWLSEADAPLAEGQIRTGVELFELTANKITYAAMGDARLLKKELSDQAVYDLQYGCDQLGLCGQQKAQVNR